MMKLRSLAFIVVAPFVGGVGRLILARWLLRGSIDPSASIGIALIDASTFTMDAGSRIGHFTIIRNLEELTLEKDARIGTFNWIFGARGTSSFSEITTRCSRLCMKTGASVTSRHILDCTDAIVISKFSTLAGFRSQILTHSIDVTLNRQVCEPVYIGPYSFIGTHCIVLKGARFPARSVLAAGSVFSGAPREEMSLYSGVPAKRAKEFPREAKYMRRKNPRVA